MWSETEWARTWVRLELEQEIRPRTPPSAHGYAIAHSRRSSPCSVRLRCSRFLRPSEVPLRFYEATWTAWTVTLCKNSLLRHPAVYASSRSSTACGPRACSSAATSISRSIKRHNIQIVQILFYHRRDSRHGRALRPTPPLQAGLLERRLRSRM